MITDTDVAEFQALYKKRFGDSIDKDEAYENLMLLVRQMELVYQPIKKASINENGVCNGEAKREPQQDTNSN